MSERDDLLDRLTRALPAWVETVQLVDDRGRGPVLTRAGQEVLGELLLTVARWSGEVYCRALIEAAAWLERTEQPGGPPSRASNGGYLYADDGRWAPGVLRDLAAQIAQRQQF